MEDNFDESSQQPAGEADGSAEAADPIKNVKAEFQRKFDNLSNSFAQTQAQLQQAIEAMLAAKQAPAPAAEPEAPIEDLVYSDPKKAMSIMASQAAQQATQALAQQQAQQQEFNSAVMSLQEQFPELKKAGEAQELVFQKMSKLPKHMHGTAAGAKLAILEATAELGLVPVEKRRRAAEVDEDTYATPGSRSSGASKRQPKGTEGIPAASLALAQMWGRDVNDPKVLESLRAAAQSPNIKRSR